MSMLIFFFFFSSRRRHTRCSRDWSSDVCSSDLRAKATFEEQLQFTRAEVAPGSADLIAWPENAISDVLTDDPAYLAELAGLVREKRARMIVGAHSWASRLPPRQHTSAFYLAADGTLLGRYDKLYLIPWSEYVPFERWLPRQTGQLGEIGR